MRVVFWGDEFGLKILCKYIYKYELDVVALVYSENKIDKYDVIRKIADDVGAIALKQVKDKSTLEYQNFQEKLRELNPNIGICNSYDLIIADTILNLFPMGVYNIHAAMLPKYRGGNVLNWVLVRGEKETGVTLHKMDSKIDTGDIFEQIRVEIDFKDTALTLRDKLLEASEVLIDRFFDCAINSEIVLKPQNSEEAFYLRKRTPADGYFEWTQTPLDIYNLIRALVKPWPGAWYEIDGKKYVIDSFMEFDDVVKMREEILMQLQEKSEKNEEKNRYTSD